VLVRTRLEIERDPMVQEIVGAVAGRRGWRVEIVGVPVEPDVISRDLIQKRLDTARRLLDSGDTEVALVAAWIGVEAGLRAFAKRRNLDVHPWNPHALVKTLVSLGVIPEEKRLI